MARDLTAGMQAEVVAGTVRPVILCDFVFDSGTMHVWSGLGQLSWSGNTYEGVGTFLQISAVAETSALRANGLTFSLSGLPPDEEEQSAILVKALAENYQLRPCRVWLGMMDEDLDIIADPFLIFEGRMDTMTIHDDPANPTIELTAEHHLVALERPHERRWTDEDQRVDFPTDRGFQFVSALQSKEIIWTARKETHINTSR